MEACGSLVVIGVILENVPSVTAHFPKVGGSLIALGVVGELLFGRLHKVTEDKLRDRLDAMIEQKRLELEKYHAGHLFAGGL
jgi:hypothetical protein